MEKLDDTRKALDEQQQQDEDWRLAEYFYNWYPELISADNVYDIIRAFRRMNA